MKKTSDSPSSSPTLVTQVEPDSGLKHRRRLRVFQRLLASYVLLLLGLGLSGVDWFRIETSIWDLSRAPQIIKWFEELTIAGALQLARFALFGLLVSASMPRETSETKRSRSRWGLVTIACLIATVILRAVELQRIPDGILLVVPFTGCLLGFWISSTWRRSAQSRKWLFAKLAGLLLALIGCGAVALTLSIEPEASVSEPAKVTPAEKRRVYELLRGPKHPSQKEAPPRRILLQERDIDVLMAGVLSLGSLERRAKVSLDEGRIEVVASVQLPDRNENVRYVNCRTVAKMAIADGEVDFQVDQLQIGRLRMPAVLIRFLTPVVKSALLDDPDVEAIVNAVESFKVDTGVVEIVSKNGKLLDIVLPTLLAKRGDYPDVSRAAEVYFRHLLSVSSSLPKGKERFGAYFQAAFRLARERSANGGAARENRAAIYALAAMLGHSKVELYTGSFTDEAMRMEGYLRKGWVEVHERRDWVQHYWVRRALTLVSAERVTDAVGLLKEEIDAGPGGSGFSFGDLLADRAGTLFGLAATHSDEAAVAMQNRIVDNFHLSDFFPPASDLPEGISDVELQEHYGGIGGPRYQQMLRRIERRLAACPGLQ